MQQDTSPAHGAHGPALAVDDEDEGSTDYSDSDLGSDETILPAHSDDEPICCGNGDDKKFPFLSAVCHMYGICSIGRNLQTDMSPPDVPSLHGVSAQNINQ